MSFDLCDTHERAGVHRYGNFETDWTPWRHAVYSVRVTFVTLVCFLWRSILISALFVSNKFTITIVTVDFMYHLQLNHVFRFFTYNLTL